MKLCIAAVAVTLMLAGAARAEIPSATDADVKKALSSGRPTVIDLGARQCIPCKRMAPILESLASEYRGKASVLFIDLHEDQDAAQKFRIQMIPTQIFFDAKGKEVKRHFGFIDKLGLLMELKAAGL